MNDNKKKTLAALLGTVVALGIFDDDSDDDLFMMDKKRKKRDEEDSDEEQDAQQNALNSNTATDVTSPPSRKRRRLDTVNVAPSAPLVSSLDDEDNKCEYDSPIILNVGGVQYITSIQTLTGYNSMLKARFSSKYMMKPCKDGTYFIDRDGALFEYILEYLRNGKLLLPTDWKKQELLRFYYEAKYYAITSLFNVILLKLFDSNIICNNMIKLTLLRKIMSVSDEKNETVFLERLSEWKLVHAYDYSDIKLSVKIDGEQQKKLLYGVSMESYSIGKQLILLQTENKIVGMYVEIGNNFYRFKNSFAFDCGDNSYHMIDDVIEEHLNFTYFEVRKATDVEKKIDDESRSGLIDVLYPFIVAVTNTNYISMGIHWVKDLVGVVPDRLNHLEKMEIWSIPTVAS